ncbi:MAG: hypothetical protein RLZZ608_371 [Actinomycetota bacterium]|jgi:glucose/arabinose dehydrogenase
MRQRRSTVLVLALTVALAGCAAPDVVVEVTDLPTSNPVPDTTESPVVPLAPTGETVTLAESMTTPWSVIPLATGSMLISERDTARVFEVTADGERRLVGTVPGVVPGGEGGLLGIAARDTGTPYLYAYFTAARDNRIVRIEVTGEPGSYGLGAVEVLLTGIPKARTHNGGRLAFGPDGMLYATAGDARFVDEAQNLRSLAGKILRMTPEGDVPADNPFAGSYVYSYGHRNPQGLAFDSTGQLWASELGQNTWDELNRIEAGANYGWPLVEGIGGRDGFVDPVQQWRTSTASPSGLGVVGDTLFMASLRGKRLWAIDIAEPGVSTAYFAGELGRIRDAVAGPDGTLLLLTTNTDVNGIPGPTDDRLLQVTLAPRD